MGHVSQRVMMICSLHGINIPTNPVIPVPAPGEKGHGEYIVFDPCAWLEGDTYYALIGNRIPGQSGDGTALFKSSNLAEWEFVRSFYESRREWTYMRKRTAPFLIFIHWVTSTCCCFVAIGWERNIILVRFENEQYHVESVRKNELAWRTSRWTALTVRCDKGGVSFSIGSVKFAESK